MRIIINEKFWFYDTVNLHRTIDADTYELRCWVDCGFKLTAIPTPEIRLRGIDCPESRSLNLAEKQHGLEAKAFAEKVLTEVGISHIHSYRVGRSFTRWIADIWLKDGRSLADVMRAAGFEKRAFY